MNLARRLEAPNSSPEQGAALRLSSDEDLAIGSPVHDLQAGLGVLVDAQPLAKEKKLPGWFRVAFPVASSLALWALLIGGVRLIA